MKRTFETSRHPLRRDDAADRPDPAPPRITGRLSLGGQSRGSDQEAQRHAGPRPA
ncbi:hypothetical protein [Sphingomonas sp. PAMC 26621]|uniref:hypothetical protein n=1 Tax=Sphingomonas sp. PAMC 26621 TaxID=1112213 RepID=UPI000288F82D|nr:hypothetical protein [Sphingomonas sp. PAMC 26621]